MFERFSLFFTDIHPDFLRNHDLIPDAVQVIRDAVQDRGLPAW